MSLGNGTTLVRANDADPVALEDIGKTAVELGGIEMSRDVNENTKYSNNTGYKEFYGALRDAGEISFKVEMEADPALVANLRADYNSDDPRQYGLQWPDSGKTQFLCDGLVTKFKILNQSGEKLFVELSIKWSGEPNWGVWA